jgi:hypothetical protein
MNETAGHAQISYIYKKKKEEDKSEYNNKRRRRRRRERDKSCRARVWDPEDSSRVREFQREVLRVQR